MNEFTLTCRDGRRRGKARERSFNGIDYVEVGADQTSLCVHLFGDVPKEICKGNVRVEGGRRVRDIRVIAISSEPEDDPELGECLRVIVDRPGDFSNYRLCLVETENDLPTDRSFPGFDPRYACAEFSFKVDCPSDLDCRPESSCQPEDFSVPEINYLAKDYAGFRQLLFDRLALLMPEWRERHLPDIGVALVEVLAYAGDHLSYYQDAVATEAYLGTARERISVRRHARLVDYQMHDGCNARAFVFLETDRDCALPYAELYFASNCTELELVGDRTLTAEAFKQLNIPESHYVVFEPLVENELESVQLYVAHNSISFYTWGDVECCLPRGATRATLKDEWEDPISAPGDSVEMPEYKRSVNYKAKAATKAPTDIVRRRKLNLVEGDVVVFEEIFGPGTGNPADADLAHRHAVTLTKVEQGIDPLENQPIVEIEWAPADALPFPLCISVLLAAPKCEVKNGISVARANIILVNHGRTIEPSEPLDPVPVKTTVGACECGAAEMSRSAARFRPVLKQGPLTFSQPFEANLAASAMLNQDPRRSLAQIKSLVGLPGDCQETDGVDEAEEKSLPGDFDSIDSIWRWFPRRDLLSSQRNDSHFVVETDNNGYAHLRFGDGELGRAPEACTNFKATYRVGNGTVGNVGADAITRLIFRDAKRASISPRNPLPAQGGVEPEPLAEVKLFASGAFRKDLQRAITADDYARLAERNQQTQRAAAELRWTGSWYEARVAIDPRGTEGADDRLLHEIEGQLHPYRRIGYDMKVVPARYVPLEIELAVCVMPHYQLAHVKAALLEIFSNRVLSGGQRGFFHPDNLTFGNDVYLSRLIATAQGVAGVESVTVRKLQRRFAEPNREIEDRVLPLGAKEVAQLDNDPNFPEHGKLTLTMEGGR
jgi:hypothetical protein